MKIDSIRVGFISTNCYLLCDEETGVCALIDPGDKPEQVADMVSRSGCRLEYILLTHGHFDHTTAVRPLLEKYPDVPVYINEKDVTDQPPKHMDMMFSRLPEHNQRYYKEGDTLTLGSLTIRVMETPGHTQGSVCLLVGDVMFSGDTLFRGSCGRTDFAGGDPKAIADALRRRLRQELGREPVLSELSEASGLTPEEIAQVEIATDTPESLQRETADGLTLEGMLGTDAPEEGMVERIALRESIDQLPEKERMTILLRYFKGLTQEQTARILGVSQVQVSRLERRGLKRLREFLSL